MHKAYVILSYNILIYSETALTRDSTVISTIIGVKVMMFNATYIAVISFRSGLLVEETGENHRPTASH